MYVSPTLLDLPNVTALPGFALSFLSFSFSLSLLLSLLLSLAPKLKSAAAPASLPKLDAPNEKPLALASKLLEPSGGASPSFPRLSAFFASLPSLSSLTAHGSAPPRARFLLILPVAASSSSRREAAAESADLSTGCGVRSDGRSPIVNGADDFALGLSSWPLLSPKLNAPPLSDEEESLKPKLVVEEPASKPEENAENAELEAAESVALKPNEGAEAEEDDEESEAAEEESLLDFDSRFLSARSAFAVPFNC